MASFDRIKHPEEGVLREEHRGTVQKTLAAFNASAVRVGSAQKSMKSLFSNFSKRHLSYQPKTPILAFLEIAKYVPLG
ncbi:uncharacterized protein LOC131241121 isoform X2 [Magnolia sinica]|uniref:uncharacterized protein LOC131241121 isoform X2 n=1 Tax=Magnolia sinica TaxID=86752 RepID=UPI0026587240|nr:uncharacterized protein LOC131241121 isoform X2 [Magnolia sinica]